jgi:hypothetical protein
MKLKNLALALTIFTSASAFAQEESVDPVAALNERVTLLEDAKTVSGKLKFSGYVQSEWQSTQVDVNGKASQDFKVGSALNPAEVIDGSANRFGVRRGRLKATYTDNGCTGVFYIDATEKGVVLKEAYVSALDPWAGIATLRGGIFNKPFGYEIEYSSSSRESPERSRIIQTLFPNERDLGAVFTLQAPKSSPWNVVKLDFGFLAGNAIGTDTKSKKDLIARLAYASGTSNFKYGFGMSYYNGSLMQTTTKVYEMNNGVFASVGDSASNKFKYAKKEYYGFDGQFSIASVAGLTTIRGEYIFGTQPGTTASSSSYNNTPIPTPVAPATTVDPKIGDTYMRKFSGGYVHLIQDILDTKHSLAVKYDWYDPNTDVAGDLIGASLTPEQKSAGAIVTNKTDIAYSTLGFGYIYRMNKNVKFMVYYDMPVNETSSKLVQTFNKDNTKKGTDFTSKLNAELLTVRMQYKF